MPRLAFLQFYPNDWLAEPSIRSCSLAARGLWIDMLSLMHLSPRRGYLLAVNGKPHTHEQIARLTGCSSDDVSLLLAELQSSGCFSCTSDGTIYSRRMVRDEEIRQVRSDAGRKGGEISGKSRVCLSKNPSKREANHQAKSKLPETRDQRPEEENPPPPFLESGRETSENSQTALLKAKDDLPWDAAVVPLPHQNGEFERAWREWVAMRAAKKKTVTNRIARLSIEKLRKAGFSLTEATECVFESAANGWLGLVTDRILKNRTAGANGKAAGRGNVRAEAEVARFKANAEIVRQTERELAERTANEPVDADFGIFGEPLAIGPAGVPGGSE